MRLTDRGIEALRAKNARYEVWEDGRTGLGVRVSIVGRKSWIYMYRFNGKPRRMTLGTYPAVGLADARVKHANAKAGLDKGIDPGAKEIERKTVERTAETVADLAEEYLEKWARPRKRSAAEDERTLRKEVLPLWNNRKAKDITRRDVITLLDGIVERGSPIQANRTLAVIRKMFNFAISRDIVDATPVAMVKAPAKENQRDRVLSAEEIRALWKGLDTAPMSEGIKLVLKLQLATAQRKGEIVGAAAFGAGQTLALVAVSPCRIFYVTHLKPPESQVQWKLRIAFGAHYLPLGSRDRSLPPGGRSEKNQKADVSTG